MKQFPQQFSIIEIQRTSNSFPNYPTILILTNNFLDITDNTFEKRAQI